MDLIACDRRPLYRVRKPIAYKGSVIPRGALHRLEKVSGEGIRRLKARGTINEVQGPPLEALPGWTRRGARLAAAGIEGAAQFLGADLAQTARVMRVKPRTVQRWKDEVREWLTPELDGRRR
ncbi:MAG: hypothetical protein GTO03_13465 [Planctomycetales bacterium]|nr:hypothetical protein [Planctomycetales bacterium]